MLDFTRTPIFAKYKLEGDPEADLAEQICQNLLAETGVVIVPTSDFGVANAGRISLVLEQIPFSEALEKTTRFFASELTEKPI